MSVPLSHKSFAKKPKLSPVDRNARSWRRCEDILEVGLQVIAKHFVGECRQQLVETRFAVAREID